MKIFLPTVTFAFNPCRQGETYIPHSRRCVVMPMVELNRQVRNDYTFPLYRDEPVYEYEDRECKDGFEWDKYTKSCHDIDECVRESYNCDKESQTCINTEGSFHCVCGPGFEIRIPTYEKSDSFIQINSVELDSKCHDIDECLTQCQGQGQKCTNFDGGYDCECDVGYKKSQSDNCQDINECDTNPCHENEACRNLEGGFECVCLRNHTRNEGGECISESPCKSKGQICQWKCIDINSESFRCECPSGYTLIGNMCLDQNECASGRNDCAANEQCLNVHGRFICNEFTPCPVGFDSVRGWLNEFNRVKQDSNICHRKGHCDEKITSMCQYNLIVTHSTDLLSNHELHTLDRKGNKRGVRLYRFDTTARYGSSASYGYKIMTVTDGQNNSKLQDEEFAVQQQYSSRPRASLLSMKPISYTKDANSLRDIEILYFAKNRRGKGEILYQELIKMRVFISEYEF